MPLECPQRAADLSQAKLLSRSSILASQHSAQRQPETWLRALELLKAGGLQLGRSNRSGWLSISALSVSSQLLAMPKGKCRRWGGGGGGCWA